MYNFSFLAQGPYFIDKELILSCIDQLHDLTIKDDGNLESKYLIGNGSNGLYGQLALNNSSKKILSPKLQTVDSETTACDW